jgi:tetratricopeptide (TPR) repeat protein
LFLVAATYALALGALLVHAAWAVRILGARDGKRRGWVLWLSMLLTVAATALALAAVERLAWLALYAMVAGAAVLAINLALSSLVAMRLSVEAPAWVMLPKAEQADRAGHHAAAASGYERILEVLRKARNRRGEVSVLLNLGRGRLAAAAPAEAVSSFEAAVETARDLHDPTVSVRALLSLAAAQVGEEELVRARSTLQDALAIASTSKRQELIAEVSTEIAWLLYLAGEFDEAEPHLARAVRTGPGSRNPALSYSVALLAGCLNLRKGLYGEARHTLGEATEFSRRLSDPDRHALLDFALAIRDYLEGWHDTGAQEIARSLGSLTVGNRRELTSRWLLGLSWLARSKDRVQDAEAFAAGAVQLTDPLSPLRTLARYCADPAASEEDLSGQARRLAAMLDRDFDPPRPARIDAPTPHHPLTN